MRNLSVSCAMYAQKIGIVMNITCSILTNKIGNCSERTFTEFVNYYLGRKIGAPLMAKKSPHPLLGSNLRPHDRAVSTLYPTMTVSVHAGVVDLLCSRQSEPKQQLRNLCVCVC